MKINDFQTESWSQKYKSSINCSHPKGFSQRAHCAGKNKQNESVEMEMVCEDCGMCKSHGSLNEIKKGQKDSNGYTRCWPGKHAEGTKKGKNGGQVRNCVPNESIQESKQRCKQCGMTDCSCRPGTCKCKPIKGWIPNKGFQKAMAEGVRDLGYDAQSLIMKLRRDIEENRLQPTRQAVLAAARELAGDMSFAPELLVQQVLGQGVAEGELRFDPLVAEIVAKMQGPTKDDAEAALITVLGTRAYTERPGFYSLWLRQAIDKYSKESVAEGFNGEYDDEAGMAQGNLYTIAQAAQGLLDTIDDNDNLPEWAQEKIAKVEGMLVAVWNYLQSQKAQGIDPEINEMYEAMDQLAEEMAAKKGISADLVWESFEALDDNMLYETAAWRRKEGKSKKGGLNAKGVASYRRENPGSKLQTAVTTKPSKLKPGSKAAKRRKSFCARMSGVKGPAKKPNGEPTRKTLALRKWNC